MPQPEQLIQNEIMRMYCTKPWLRLWRANTGTARFRDRTVSFGVKGQADLSGILPDGRRLEIEVKTPTGKQTHAQKCFQQMIEKYNGVYILARSVSDVAEALCKAGYTEYVRRA